MYNVYVNEYAASSFCTGKMIKITSILLLINKLEIYISFKYFISLVIRKNMR